MAGDHSASPGHRDRPRLPRPPLRPRRLGRLVEQRRCLGEIAGLEHDLRDARGAAEAGSATVAGRRRAESSRDRRREVSPVPCRSPGRGQQDRGTHRDRRGPFVRRPELHLVAIGLLEVVADDLVVLDELGAPFLEPARETLVQVGPCRLRQERRRRRPGSVGGGSGRRLRPGAARDRGAPSPCARARRAAARPVQAGLRAPGPRRCGRADPRPSRARGRAAPRGRAGRAAPRGAP